MCSKISWCMNRSEFSKRFNDLVSDNDNSLDQISKRILKARYINIVNNLEVSSKRASFWYLAFSYITTIGSIIVPALISVQDKTFDFNSTESGRQEHQNNVYWASWGVSLTVTLSNALLKLLSLDKIHITRKLRSSHLKSEGWLYLELAGDYTRFRTHQRAFIYFCNKIEKIKSEQIKEEYTFDNIIREPFNEQIRNRGKRSRTHSTNNLHRYHESSTHPLYEEDSFSPTRASSYGENYPPTPTSVLGESYSSPVRAGSYDESYAPAPADTSYTEDYSNPRSPPQVSFNRDIETRTYVPEQGMILNSRSLDQESSERPNSDLPIVLANERPEPVDYEEELRRVSIYPDYENRDENYPFGVDLTEEENSQFNRVSQI